MKNKNEFIEKIKPFVYCYSGSEMLTNEYNDDVASKLAEDIYNMAKEHFNKSQLREILIFSNGTDEIVNYKKRYWFHHWVSRYKAMIEDEEGNLIILKQEGNFKFKNFQP